MHNFIAQFSTHEENKLQSAHADSKVSHNLIVLRFNMDF